MVFSIEFFLNHGKIYLKGMEKAVPPSYAKYCRMEQSKSLVLLDFLVN